MKTLVFTIDAGSGHKATAEGIIQCAPKEMKEGIVLVNPYRQVVSPFSKYAKKKQFVLSGLFSFITVRFGENFYNFTLSRMRFNGLIQRILDFSAKTLQTTQSNYMDKVFREYLSFERPDLVICVTPAISVNLSKQATLLGIPILVVMTDLDEIYPDFWIPRTADYFCTFGQNAYKTSLGRDIKQSFLLSGPVLRPMFFQRDEPYSERLAKKLKLSPDKTTIIVFFGGFGSPKMLDIAQLLNAVQRPVQAIFLCGHTSHVQDKINKINTSYPKLVFGFIKHVDRLMELGAIMIGKPGPGAVLEAIAKGNDVLLELNRSTMSQEVPIVEYATALGRGESYANNSELLTLLNRKLETLPSTRHRRQSPFRSDLEITAILKKIEKEIKPRQRN
ncbi:MGDG synthase family glycosyltransferase [Flexibacterium corallicola]|uniref:MGDG synthase family glycosyltransferase n=1 Tax=Flexibacterium corallicola TaxID=3037259 RepID=UPI00286F7A4D|nr:hypothetical protein [Pseudovibrio sp. M1P-2-3]